MRTRELVERGMDPAAARRLALERAGDVRQLRRTCVNLGRKRDREMRLTRWLEEIRDDVTFAVRQLRAAPGFALVAVVTLALGIGANSAMFALADATLLRPFPFREPERLAMVWESFQSFPRTGVSWLNFRDWNERNRTFHTMAGVFVYPRRLAADDGSVEQVPATQVTYQYFDVLGVRAIAGRTFLPSDVVFPPNVTVISEGLWRTRFGADPGLIGRTIQIDGQAFTVVGVVPEEAQTLNPSSLWTVWAELPGMDARGLRFMRVVGRLKPGVTLEAAQSDMTSIAESLAQEFPATNKERGATVDSLRRGLIGPEVRLTSMLFLGVVGFVLLMCCANVANLLLARASGRARELAVRSALGAGRRRIVTQILTESLVLSALGGLLGLGVGLAIIRVAPALIPPGLLPSAVTLGFDTRVVAFCASTAFLTGLLFGLAPAWQASGTALVQIIGSESRTSTRGGGRLRSLLVVGEVAAAALLLCGAGLLLRTLMVLDNVDAGYRADDALTMTVSLSYGLPSSRFPNEASLSRFFESVEREVARLPGVRSVGWTSGLPLTGNTLGSFGFEIVGDEPPPATNRPTADYQLVSPDYFQTLEIPLLAGRTFTNRDTAASTPVCLVSRAFVERYLRGRDPLGMRIAIRPMQIGPATPIVREVVGVVGQVKSLASETVEPAQVYVPLAQNAFAFASLVVRPTEGRPAALTAAVREAAARVDRGVPFTQVRTLDEVAYAGTARYRFRAVMVMTFAALALLLAMVGVFGVLAYSVQQRAREFGVRIALGASAGSVVRLVLGNASRVIAAGASIGLVAAAIFARSISTFLFGVPPLDPITFGAVASLLVVTAGLAVAAPAWRATRVDPVVAFRTD
jgi:putative ABC transport system permease protein